MARRFLLTLLLVGLGTTHVVGCGDDDGDGGDPDAGMADATSPDTGPELTGTCESPEEVTGETVTVAIDTTEGPAGVLDLGACGGGAAEAPPQHVVAYTVPGTGTQAVTFTTAASGTDAEFDTLVQVRSDCATAPASPFPPSCFDDGEETLHSTGTVTAEGGSVLYFVVTGDGDDSDGGNDSGVASLEISAQPNAAPTFSEGMVTVNGHEVTFHVSGGDTDGNLMGFVVRFLHTDHVVTHETEPVDWNGDGAVDDGDLVVFHFDPSVAGMTTIDVMQVIAGHHGGEGDPLGQRMTEGMIDKVDIRLVDMGWALSEELRVDVFYLNSVGLGEGCGGTNVCSAGLMCDTETTTCVPTEAATTSCGASMEVTLTPPVTTTSSTTVTGDIPAGMGGLMASCVMHTHGAEVIYDVAVPTGDYDLIATTDLDGTGTTNTVLHVRTDCVDPGAEVACNNDVVMDDPQSRVEILDAAEGTYSVVVERMGPSDTALPYEMEISLRPVLATGVPCDPTEVDNRCAGGMCPSSGTCP